MNEPTEAEQPLAEETPQDNQAQDLIPDKTQVPGRAKSWDYDTTQGKQVFLKVLFEITGDGPYAGRHLRWDGYFSEKAFARTIESLEHCGWTGDDVGAVTDLDKNEVQLVVGLEEYNGKTFNRVNWVNRAASLRVFSPPDDAQKSLFANEMRGKLLLLRQGKPNNGPPARPSPAKPNGAPAAPPKSLDEIPF